jgi:anhydro-N-acetylmuramic acid kinase
MKDFFAQLNKLKSRRYLIVSAGGPQSGIQGVYLAIEDRKWSILSQALIPYPRSVKEAIFDILKNPQVMIQAETIRQLDFKISTLFLECAKTICAATQKSQQQPHAIAMNKFILGRENHNESSPPFSSKIELGDAHQLFSWFKIPTITDFNHFDIPLGKIGDLPLFPGLSLIKGDADVVVAHCTIGMLAHFFIYDTNANHTILDTDIGPGTCLINKAASEAKCPDYFDRDGSASAQGKVHVGCLQLLASHKELSSPVPRSISLSEIMQLYDHPCLQSLDAIDKLSTLTALTARTIFDVYKNIYRHVVKPETIWLSGGGANNLTLQEFLRTYFAPLPVKRIDEAGVPVELFVPLALGLSIDAYYTGDFRLKKGNMSEIEELGIWVYD